MFVRARIDEGVNDKALVVPQVGVTHDQKGQPTALVVGPDNKVALRQLVTSGTYGDKWVVDSGLNPGDRVIVQGTEKARPGTTVKPVDAQLPAQAAQPASGAAPGAASGAAPAAADAGASGVAASSNPAPASAASGA
jgi:membrane fusion protein (multidrug efflux system)